MAQADYFIANDSGAGVRADINANLDAIASNNAGSTPPTVTYSRMWWFDESLGMLKMRNSTNTGWLSVARMGAEGWEPFRGQNVLTGFPGMHVFGASGIWNVPSNLKWVYVECLGAGGSGAGGALNGLVGGTSSFGSFMTAAGGDRGFGANNDRPGGLGGTVTASVSGSTIVRGAPGGPSAHDANQKGGYGGSSVYGGGGNAGAPAGTTTAMRGGDAGLGGGGGGGKDVGADLCGSGAGAGAYVNGWCNIEGLNSVNVTVGQGGAATGDGGGAGGNGIVIIRW